MGHDNHPMTVDLDVIDGETGREEGGKMKRSVHGDDLRREVVSFQSICIKSESEPT
jgi:hypothetical protein